MTAGMAAKSPAAVVMSASAMPGATARKLAAPALPRPEKASITPAAGLFGGGELHAHGHGLNAFQLGGMRVSRAHLALEFTEAGGIDSPKRRAGRGQRLRIGDALRRPEYAQELIAFPAHASEEPQLLKYERPRKQREHKKKRQDNARDPSCLGQDGAEIADEKKAEEKNDQVPPEQSKFADNLQPSTRVGDGQNKTKGIASFCKPQRR